MKIINRIKLNLTDDIEGDTLELNFLFFNPEQLTEVETYL